MSAVSDSPRIDIENQWPEGYKIMYQFYQAVQESGLDHGLLNLIKIRASQINRCAFCINLYTTEARDLGEAEQRIALLPAFEEAPCYTEAEKAVLSLTEAVTKLPEKGVPDEILANVRQYFDESQLAKLVFAVILINAWNRIGVTDHLPFAVEGNSTPQPK